MSLFDIANVHTTVEDTPILKGLSLTVEPGEIHAIMGPNGSGKSTLVNTLMGHPAYEVTKGEVQINGENLLAMEPNERSTAGLFLAFQYPKEIAGVTLRSFLYAAYSAHKEAEGATESKLSPLKFKAFLEEQMHELKMDPAFAERFVNQGFSGGEKKKAEILQMKILQPQLALLDETDSGLDVDALKIVAEGVNSMRSSNFSAVIVTHYARILDYITPDKVHAMVDGTIVKTGDASYAKELEEQGYEQFEKKGKKLALE